MYQQHIVMVSLHALSRAVMTQRTHFGFLALSISENVWKSCATTGALKNDMLFEKMPRKIAAQKHFPAWISH